MSKQNTSNEKNGPREGDADPEVSIGWGTHGEGGEGVD